MCLLTPVQIIPRVANISPSVSGAWPVPGVGLPGRILPSGLPRVSQTSPFNNLDGADYKEDDTNFPTSSQLLDRESEARQAPGLCQWTHSPCPGWLAEPRGRKCVRS